MCSPPSTGSPGEPQVKIYQFFESAKFIPSSDKYMEAWTALNERFGRVDTVVSAAKRRVDQFPVIMKENSEQIRQYQEMVSELMGVYEEHNFVHELNSQIPEANVAKLPVL